MKGSPRSSHIPAWDLPGVQEIRNTRRQRASLGLDWALVVFCTFGAPPALVVAGLLSGGGSPVVFWLGACGVFFTGLALSLRLRPLPPRPVFASAAPVAPDALARPALFELGIEPDLPGIAPGMSRPELLEQLAKLRERGDLSNAEYAEALYRLLGE